MVRRSPSTCRASAEFRTALRWSVRRRATSAQNDTLVFNLNRGDFTTARRVADSINQTFGPDVAAPMDATSIVVHAPQDPVAARRFSVRARKHQRGAGCSAGARHHQFAHRHHRHRPARRGDAGGGYARQLVGDDLGKPDGEPAECSFLPAEPRWCRTRTLRSIRRRTTCSISPGVSLQDIVTSVNEVGAAPGDLMAILEALKEAGALRAELVVI